MTKFPIMLIPIVSTTPFLVQSATTAALAGTLTSNARSSLLTMSPTTCVRDSLPTFFNAKVNVLLSVFVTKILEVTILSTLVLAVIHRPQAAPAVPTIDPRPTIHPVDHMTLRIDPTIKTVAMAAVPNPVPTPTAILQLRRRLLWPCILLVFQPTCLFHLRPSPPTLRLSSMPTNTNRIGKMQSLILTWIHDGLNLLQKLIHVQLLLLVFLPSACPNSKTPFRNPSALD
ncbi:hypothetical protein Ae201684P_021277 [Aphanomyces euteiches]|nr:hypothetical protein Ae201684P_021277 [Aphanomyces euteiches]